MSDDNPFLKRMAADAHRRGPKCLFCKQVMRLTEDQRQKLYDAMFGVSELGVVISSPTIRGVLDDWGVSTSTTALNAHRTGQRPNCIAMMEARWS